MSESETPGNELIDDMEVTEEEGENVKGGHSAHQHLTHHEKIMKHREENERRRRRR